MLDFTFPTQLIFPMYPNGPAPEDNEALTAFLDALRAFFNQLQQQQASTSRYFSAASFYFNDGHAESTVRTESADVTQQAISAVIKNIAQPVKREYVWDANENRWVLVLSTP
jgi:hypothetical protein